MISSPLFPQSFTSPAQKIVVMTFALMLCVVLAACNPFAPKGNSGGNDDGKGGHEPPTPEMVESDGFWRPSTLGEPLAKKVVERPTDDGLAKARLEVVSLDSDGTSARMVAVWLPPVEGLHLSPEELRSQEGRSQRVPWTRLADFDAKQVIEPYQGTPESADGSFKNPPQPKDLPATDDSGRNTNCVCSYGPEEIEETSTAPESLRLFYADFPAPESDNVSVLFGDNAAVLEGVTVSSGKKFDVPELVDVSFIKSGQDDLPDVYGSGAVGQRRIAMDVNTESVTDASVSDRGETSALNVSSDVLFEFDSDKLNKDAQKTIDSVAEELKKSAKGQKVVVEGHTDDEGDEGYNQGLSERRAVSVKKAVEPKLSGAGVQLETKGFGETKPIAPNRDGKGNPIKKNQAKNRRVSFNFKPQGQIDASVDTGKKVKDLPEMKSATSNGGITAGVLPTPKGGDTPELNFDVKDLEEQGDFLKLTVAVSTVSGQDDTSAFDQQDSKVETMPFGQNFTAEYPATPSLSNLALWDKTTNMMATTVTAGPGNCLCSQTMSPADYAVARGEPIEMYAYFPKASMESDELIIRVADTAQIKVNRTQAAGASSQAPSPLASRTTQG
ncbi:OmpA family protein [Brevibacterium paucivorans]